MKTIIAIIITVVIIGGAIFFTKSNNSTSGNIKNKNDISNVTIIDGKQIIEIKAKGGYTPRVSIAKANFPTILRFNTKGTFDCSLSVRIPSMSISKILPQSGSTDIDLGIPKVGVLDGTCGMGMYNFQIEFQS